jgi:hypothetical protein
MGPDLDALYTSAPIDADGHDLDAPTTEEVLESAGVMTLAPEAFDAAVLEALVHP